MNSAGLSESGLSQTIGRSRAWLNGLLSRGAWPSGIDCYQIAEALDCSMSELFKNTAEPASPRSGHKIMEEHVQRIMQQRGYNRPEIYDLINWHAFNKGLLIDHEPFQDFVEIFGPPDLERQMVVPHWLGKHTLSSAEMGLRSADDLVQLLKLSDDRERFEIVRAHSRVFETGKPDITTRTIDLDFCEGLQTSIDYIRIILPVKTEEARGLVLSYSSPLRRTERTTKEIIHFEAEPDRRVIRTRS